MENSGPHGAFVNYKTGERRAAYQTELNKYKGYVDKARFLDCKEEDADKVYTPNSPYKYPHRRV